MTDEYPDELIRGIACDNDQYITAEGYPTQAVFQFEEYDPKSREDNYRELSINWLDNPEAVDLLLGQVNERKGGFQFQGGYCRIARSVLHATLAAYFTNSHLNYERKPTEASDINPENPYHGNILINNKLSKPAAKNIQVALAAMAGTITRR